MAIYLTILRIIHVVAAFVWVGGAFMMAGFIEPTITAMGPEGGKFMGYLNTQRRFGMVMGIAATLTVVAGALLYERLFSIYWTLTGPGISLTIGAIAGFIAFGIGVGVTSRASARMTELGKQMAAGGPPKPEVLAEMKVLQQRLHVSGQWAAITAAVAVFGMAAAQYLVF